MLVINRCVLPRNEILVYKNILAFMKFNTAKIWRHTVLEVLFWLPFSN